MVNDHGQSALEGAKVIMLASCFLSEFRAEEKNRYACQAEANERFRSFRTNLRWLAGILVLLLASALGQAESDPWLIPASGAKGPINRHTTREDLIRSYGSSNVVDQDADVGEGEIEPERFFFGKTPNVRSRFFGRIQPERRSLGPPQFEAQ